MPTTVSGGLEIFPTLPGLVWSVMKAPTFATRVQRGISGRELRVSDQQYPIWEWTLQYDVLFDQSDVRQTNPKGPGIGHNPDLRTLMGFFCSRKGSFQAFAYVDPTDSSVTNEFLGTGDGVSNKIQLTRSLGGWIDLVTDFNVITQVRYNGVNQGGNFSGGPLNNPGLLTDIRGPVPSGVSITADFTYYWRVRFSNDMTEFENFMYQLWSTRQIKFKSVLP